MAAYKTINGKKGKKIQATVRVKGYKPKYKTFDSKTKAKEWATELEVLLKNGQYKEIKTSNSTIEITTVGSLIDYFYETQAKHRYSDYKKYTNMYNWWKNQIGHILITKLTTSTLSQCKEILAAEPPSKPYKGNTTKGNNTVNKYLMCLSAVLTYAVRELEIIPVNPMSNVTKKKKPNGRVRFLSEDEIKKLISACEEHSETLHLFVLMAISTGGRYNEIRTVKIENIDFKNEIFHFIDTKNNESRGVPAHKSVLEKLKEYIKINNIESGYIFSKNKNDKLIYLKGSFENVIKKIGIEDFRFHDLRHTCASYLAMNGASLLDIAEILGHKTLNMVKRYAHLTKKHTSAIINKTGSSMLNI